MKIIRKRSFNTRQQEWLFCVYNDPEFQKESHKLPTANINSLSIPETWNKYQLLGSKYKITKEEVGLYKFRGIDAIYENHKHSVAYYDSDMDNITLYIPKDILEKDFRKLWRHISRVQKDTLINKPSRRKTPNYIDLVYAIFKARVKNKTFSEIFNDYNEGKLKYYSKKPIKWINSVEKLKDYYYKYGPENQNS